MSREYRETYNERQYEKYLSCGYTGEMAVNEHGWCSNEVQAEAAEEIVLFDRERCHAYIRFAELPNGRWIAASGATFPTHGYGCPLSVWCDQHDTKEDAIEAELKRIEESVEPKDAKAFICAALKNCRDALRPAAIPLF